MRFLDSIYGNYCSIIFNNTFLTKTKYDELCDCFTKLKQLLISGETEFPKLTLEFQELIDVNNTTYLGLYESLVKRQNNRVTGFSKIKVYEAVDPDIDFTLEDLDFDFKNVVLQLQKIFETTNKDINNYKLLIYLITNIETILRTKTQIDGFDLYTSLFRFIYEKSPLSNNYTQVFYRDSQFLSIPFFITFNFLKKVFESCNSPSNIILNDLYSTPSLPILNRNHLSDCYSRYLDENAGNVSHDLAKYLSNVIFDFGINISPTVFNKLKTHISELLLKTKNIVKANLKILSPNDYIFRIVNGTIQNTITTTLLSSLSSQNSMFWTLDRLTVYNQDVHDKIYQYEDIISANSGKYLSQHTVDLKLLNHIHIKYAANPLFAMNAHILVYAKFALNYLEDTNCFTQNDVQWWLDNILKGSNIDINNLISYINSIKLEYNNSDLNFSCFLVLQEFLDNLTTSDVFKSFIMDEFIPKIDILISREYKVDINWYQMVDKIIYIFKLLLSADLIQALEGNNTKLFYEISSFLGSKIEPVVTNHNCDPRREEITSIFDYERSDITRWYNFFNSFFKTSIVAFYAKKVLYDLYSV